MPTHQAGQDAAACGEAMTPTQRSLAWLKANGYACEIVCYWHHFAKHRVDFLGVADLLAWKPGTSETLAIQVTDDTHHAKRRAKILASERARRWVDCGGDAFVRSLVIHSWGK